ncbi:MAG: YHS domain-containing protein [Candidatus Marsarchaeota archaeon]|nr:YHS domain-containing protein [Candidatus Marsarchaeota archaeon]
MEKDVVCGMEVDGKNAESFEYKGKKYYFCSRACKEKFLRGPENYLAKKH